MTEIELTDHRAVVEFPEESIEVTLRCKVYVDGKIQTVEKKLRPSDIREAFRKGDDYIDENDRFTLADEGREYIGQLLSSWEDRSYHDDD